MALKAPKRKFTGTITARYQAALCLPIKLKRKYSKFIAWSLLHLDVHQAHQWATLKVAYYKGDRDALNLLKDFEYEHGVDNHVTNYDAMGDRLHKFRHTWVEEYQYIADRLKLAV
jgi:hypothetical protein